MVPFAVQASSGCSTPCNLALALAAEFVPVRRRPRRATRWTSSPRGSSARDTTIPSDQLHALAELADAHLEAVVLSSAIDDLLFDRVAPDGAGHPLLLADRLRRGGAPRRPAPWASSRAPTARSWPIASSPSPLLVDPARGALRDARTLRAPVSWQCCHQLAARDPQPHRRARRARRPRVLGAARRRAAPRAALRGADARAPGGRPAPHPRAAELARAAAGPGAAVRRSATPCRARLNVRVEARGR